MNDPSAVADRFAPLESAPVRAARTDRIRRWTVTLVALAALVLVACVAYFWLVRNVSQREAVAADTPDTTITNAPATLAASAASDAASGATSANPANAPVIAPVVTPAAVVADLGDITDPDQRRAVCGYLAAELGRLDYDFKQPLPPPVIDDIATQVTQLRAQADHYACANPPTSGVNAIAPGLLPATASQPPSLGASNPAGSPPPLVPVESGAAPVRRPEPPMLIETQPD